MAFTKTVTIPGGYSATYFSITKVMLDEDARDGEITIKVWKDKAAYDADEPGTLAGILRFPADAFDLYFSKAAVVALNVNPYAAVYAALADYTAAVKARDAIKAFDPKSGGTPPPALTDKQATIVRWCRFSQAGTWTGGELIYDGSQAA